MKHLSNLLMMMAVAILVAVPVSAGPIIDFFGGSVGDVFSTLAMAFVLMGFVVFLQKFGKK